MKNTFNFCQLTRDHSLPDWAMEKAPSDEVDEELEEVYRQAIKREKERRNANI